MGTACAEWAAALGRPGRGEKEKIMPENDTQIAVVYPVTVEALRAELEPLKLATFETPKAYAQGVKAIAQCRTLRVQIEARRKELKADSLAYGRKVDAVAKELVSVIEAVEEPLKLAKGEVDEARERAKREAEEAERARIEAELRAQREAEEARLAAERQAEAERLAAERAAQEEAARAERERLAAERAELDRQRAELEAAQRAERERQEAARREEEARLAEARRVEEARQAAERAKLEAERRELERQRFEAEAKARAEAEAIEAARRAEEERVAEAERKAALAARLEALKPDQAKLRDYADALRAVAFPTLATKEAAETLSDAVRLVRQAEEILRDFGDDISHSAGTSWSGQQQQE